MTIQDILDEARVEYLASGHHHCRPGWIQLKTCPFCGSQNYHLGYHLVLGYFSCWRCGSHSRWSVLSALKIPRETIQSFRPARAIDTARPYERRRISLREPVGRGPLTPAHLEYLRQRGLDPNEVVNFWEVEGIAIAPRLSWRLYIPIIHQGERVSWTTRAIGDRVAQRYISASAEDEVINHKHLVYGRDFCHHTIVVVEGPIDAWRIGPGAGALFGMTPTLAQMRILAAIPRRFVCLDSSPDAQRRARHLCEQLAGFPGVTENICLDAKDPGEASRREIILLRRAAGL